MCLDARNPRTQLPENNKGANNKGADQPSLRRSLVSVFVIRYLKSKVTRSDISNFSILMGFNMIKPLAMPLISHSIIFLTLTFVFKTIPKLQLSRRVDSNGYPQHMHFFKTIMGIIPKLSPYELL